MDGAWVGDLLHRSFVLGGWYYEIGWYCSGMEGRFSGLLFLCGSDVQPRGWVLLRIVHRPGFRVWGGVVWGGSVSWLCPGMGKRRVCAGSFGAGVFDRRWYINIRVSFRSFWGVLLGVWFASLVDVGDILTWLTS